MPAACALMVAMAPLAAAHAPAGGRLQRRRTGQLQHRARRAKRQRIGVAVLTLADDGSLTVNIEAQGMVPGQPHAQHVHGDSSLERDFTCPTQDADANGDGIVNTLEESFVRRDPPADDSGRRRRHPA